MLAFEPKDMWRDLQGRGHIAHQGLRHTISCDIMESEEVGSTVFRLGSIYRSVVVYVVTEHPIVTFSHVDVDFSSDDWYKDRKPIGFPLSYYRTARSVIPELKRKFKEKYP